MEEKNLLADRAEGPEDVSTSKRVSLREKLAFAIGALPDMIGFHAPKNLANPIFNVILGVNPVLIGAAIAITRVWDALIDPTVAAVSDNTRSRFGRRRPFIVVGAVVSGIAFAGMWLIPTGLSEMGYFVFILVVMMLFYSVFSVFTVPYHAIGYEMTTDYHDRTRVMAFRLFFNHAGLIAVGWVFAATQLPIFDDTLDGVKWMGLFLGIAIVLLGIVPGLFLKEKTFLVVKKQKAVPVLSSVRQAFQNRSFAILLVMAFLQVTAMNIANTFGLYVNIYYVYDGDIKGAAVVQGWGGTIGHVGAMLMLPLISRRSLSIGKRGLLRVGLIGLVMGSLSKWIFYNPEQPYLQLVSVLILSLSSIAFWLMIQSMIGDVCDEEQHRIGARREAMFGALLTWVQKIGISLGYVAAGVLLVRVGFDQALGNGQDESTILWFRMIFSLLPTLVGLLLIALLSFYSLTGNRVREIRRELDRRERETEGE